jgi:PPM family protein phosphatase
MLSQKQPWIVRAGGMSDKGRVRENNEDNLFYNEKQGIFIVSDGMGGHQAGEVASRIVVSVLPGMIEKLAAGIGVPTQSKEPYQRVLRDAILQLSQDLRDKSKGQAGLQGMGATVVVAWVRDQRAHMAYMGDSRIYLLRNGKLTQISNDHSVVALLVRHGQITEDEAKDHPARGRLSRYVGMEGDTFSDQRTIVVYTGDRLLLCSDGLTGMVSDDDIEKVLKENQDPDKACKVLIDMANEAGGKDNITAIIINFEAPHGTQESQRVPEQRHTPDQPVAPQTSMPVQHRRPEQAQSPRPQNGSAPPPPQEPPKALRQQNIPIQHKPPEQPKSPRPPNIPVRPGKPEARLPEQRGTDERHHIPGQQERRGRPIYVKVYYVGKGILLPKGKADRSKPDKPNDRHGKPDKPKPPRP